MFIKAEELPDGIGGQIYRKLLAHAHAKMNGYEYFHEPIKDLMWHPGDCFDPLDDTSKSNFISKINKLIDLPQISMPQGAQFELGPKSVHDDTMLYTRGTLKKFPRTKKIVIHIRRGNIIADQSINPRWTPDEVYRRMFVVLEKFIYDFGLEHHEIVILTDGPIDKPQYIKTPDIEFWKTQSSMNVDGDKVKLEPFNTNILNPNLDFTIINDMCSLDSIKLMLSADWLISSWSAFSTIVVLGGHYNAISNIRAFRPDHVAGHYLDYQDKDFKMIVRDKEYS